MEVRIKNDHGIQYCLHVETIAMNSYMIEIIYENGTHESIAREKNTKIITD